MSADIKTHYTLEGTTVTKSEGGSSVSISTGNDKTAKLEICVSANRHVRECALITDFPGQLVAALELELADLLDLSSLLQVPITSLKALLIRKGFTGGDAADTYEDTLVAHSVNKGSQSRSDSSYNDSCDDSLIIRASARYEAANTGLRPYMDHRLSFRPTTPEPQLQNHLNVHSHNNSSERPVTPRPTTTGLYSRDNRNLNRKRLQGFARNAAPSPSSRLARPTSQPNGSGHTFGMSTLREILEAAEPAPLSTPVQVNSSSRRRAGPIPNRNEEQMARDFEVGFLGEQFVRFLNCLPEFTKSGHIRSSLSTRYTPCYMIHSSCLTSQARTIGLVRCALELVSQTLAAKYRILRMWTCRAPLLANFCRCSTRTRCQNGYLQLVTMEICPCID